MSPEEGGPGLTRGMGQTNWTQVFLYRAFRHGNPELQQLALNALGSPEEVLFRNPLDQINRVLSQLGCVRLGPRSPFPEEAKPLAMPTQESVWLDDQKRLLPVRDPAG